MSVKNTDISVRAKLLDVARKNNRNFDSIVLQYFQERFLYRLSISAHSNHFVLKGGLIFWILQQNSARPTKDIDLSGISINNSSENIISIFRNIISVNLDDGITFAPNGITVQNITADAEYKGIRVFIPVKLTSIQKKVQIDIGFGDVITDRPQSIDFPVLIDQPVPHLLTYPPETVVAEKLQAIVHLGIINSRIKDFYDISQLMHFYPFKSLPLKRAIENTFANRDSDLRDISILHSLAEDLGEGPWMAFLKRSGIEEISSFSETIVSIIAFIEPIIDCSTDFQWDNSLLKWIE